MKDLPVTGSPIPPSSRWTADSPHRALRLALASASLLSLAAAAPLAANAASAVPVAADHAAASVSASGVYVTILSPNPQTQLAGVKQVEIRAYYESSFGVSGVDLYIDGHRMASQQLAKSEERGEISFVVEASALRAGAHSIVVRATATDQEVSSARAEMSLPAAGLLPGAPAQSQGDGGGGDQSESAAPASGSGPSVEIASPGASSVLQGIVEIKVNASDASGKAPYVSLFVDNQFKTLRNYAPYTFDLDTSHLTNGRHTVEVWGYNDAQQVTHARPLSIVVNNPGGHTFERHDLLDGPAPAAHAVRGGAVISSRPPAAMRPQPRTAELAAQHNSSAIAQLPPSIAHTARKALSQIIAKADRLASLGSTAGLLDSAGQSASAFASMAAPAFTARGLSSDTFETRTFAAPKSPGSIARSHSIVRKLQAHQVPSLRGAGHGPAVASLNPATGHSLIAATQLEAVPGLALDKDVDGLALPDASATMPQIGGAAIQQPKIKLQIHATPVPAAHSMKIASSNLGGSDAAANALKQAASGETAPQEPAAEAKAKSRAEAEARVRKPEAKEAAGQASARGMVVLADFRPHDIAALRGTEEVVVNNRSISLAQPLQDRGAMLFAPLRQIIEQQGGTLTWDADKRQVSATTAKRLVTLVIGSRTASVNNQAVKLNSAPYLYNDRTMLPLDFFQKALNAKVSYDSVTGHLLIQSK